MDARDAAAAIPALQPALRFDLAPGGIGFMARALAVQATAQAKTAYNDLLTLWQDADAKGPIIEQGRAGDARLPCNLAAAATLDCAP